MSAPARERPTSIFRGPAAQGAVRWHVAAGELGLRLFLLHLLWLAGTLAGGVVLGVFPATAALHAVLRRDHLVARREAAGLPVARRDGLVTEFRRAWREEFGRANRLGLALAVAWAVVVLDRAVLGAGHAGAWTPWMSGLVVTLTLALTVVTVMAWPLLAHFADPPGRLLRMAASLAVSRPLATLVLALVLATCVMVWGAVPGLVPVLGIALPCWAITHLVWRTGVLTHRLPGDPPA